MAQLVTLAEAKALLQSPDADDGLIADLIERASAAVESYTGRRFLHTEATERRDGGARNLVLRYRPVVAVHQVRDTETGLDVPAEDYIVDGEAGLLIRRRGRWAPGTLRWQVHYTAGYGAQVDAVPADIKQAVLQLVAGWYQRRDPGLTSERIGDYGRDAEPGLPSQVRQLLAPYIEAVV